MQFAFRWMNCLLMREMSVTCTIRMWDTYLVCPNQVQFPAISVRLLMNQSEGTDAFSQFHLYVCSALLVKYSERLREMDFQVCTLNRAQHRALPDHHHTRAAISRVKLSPMRHVAASKADSQEMIMFLQRLPTHSWTDHDVELLLSEAFVLKTVWQGAENHFANQPAGQGGGFGMLGR